MMFDSRLHSPGHGRTAIAKIPSNARTIRSSNRALTLAYVPISTPSTMLAYYLGQKLLGEISCARFSGPFLRGEGRRRAGEKDGREPTNGFLQRQLSP